MTPSERLNELHRQNRKQIGTVERFEPTRTDLLARGIVQDLSAFAAVLLVVIAIIVWSFV